MTEHEQQPVGTADDAVPTPDPAADAPPAGTAAGDVPPAASAGPDAATADAVAADGEPEPQPEPEPDWRDRYLRAAAELDNVRKRARRDAAAGETRGVARLARQLLPALDNLERALQHADEDTDVDEADRQFVEGVRIVHRELLTAMGQTGVEAFDPTGEAFDPHLHEAITQQPAPEGTEAGIVLTTYQTGYRLKDEILRPAKVIVSG
ncbi:MAG: nucleotide exchange factor GrpE [Solirubrobacteraceae bacterium]|nr:nucleotide exchange factor GrpE [Solirubrobacteraceae bacterium]